MSKWQVQITYKCECQGPYGSECNKTSRFDNSVFVQNMLPGPHQILVKKDGYYDYQKNLEVIENQVAKLEHVILFKKERIAKCRLFEQVIDGEIKEG